MITACIVALIITIATLVVILSKPGNSNDNNSEYYVDGFHIYYDRKIIRHLKK